QVRTEEAVRTVDGRKLSHASEFWDIGPEGVPPLRVKIHPFQDHHPEDFRGSNSSDDSLPQGRVRVRYRPREARAIKQELSMKLGVTSYSRRSHPVQVAEAVRIVRLHERVSKVVDHLRRSLRVFGVDLRKRVPVEKRRIGVGSVSNQRVGCVNRELTRVCLGGGSEFTAPAQCLR